MIIPVLQIGPSCCRFAKKICLNFDYCPTQANLQLIFIASMFQMQWRGPIWLQTLPFFVDSLDSGQDAETPMVSNVSVKRGSPRALIPCKNFPQRKIHPRSRNSSTSTIVDQKSMINMRIYYLKHVSMYIHTRSACI